jgi:hypothetical protein
MLDQEGPVTKGKPGNKKANQAPKEVLDEDIPTTERYPPDDLKKWLTLENFKKRNQRWKNENNEMKERKPDVDRKEDTNGMPRKEQVVELRIGNMRATHGLKMEGIGNPLCPFCNTNIFNGLQHC